MIGEDNACAFVGFEDDMVVLALTAAIIGHAVVKAPRSRGPLRTMDGHAPRHAQMDDQRFAAIQIEQQIFCPSSQPGHMPPLQPQGKVRRERFTQIGAVHGHTQQGVTLKRGGNVKFSPFAFTEHGAIMAANILNSPQAVQMSVFVVRAFVKMRSLLTDTRELAKKLAALETELKSRLDSHETAIVDVLQRIMLLLDPPPGPETPAKEMGFHTILRSARKRKT